MILITFEAKVIHLLDMDSRIRSWLKIIEGPRIWYASIISSDIYILQNVLFCVLEKCPGKVFNDCQRQTPKQAVSTHRLVITS